MARSALVVLALLAASLAFVRRSPARGAAPLVSVPAAAAAGRLPEGAWNAQPEPRPTPRPSGHLIAYARSGVALRARPGGRVVERLSGRTGFGSPQALAVVHSRRGRWLAVSTPELGNGRLAWVDARAGALRFARTRLGLHVDLSPRPPRPP